MNAEVFETVCKVSWNKTNSEYDSWYTLNSEERGRWQEAVAAVLDAAGFRV